jgi:hypothetical protein
MDFFDKKYLFTNTLVCELLFIYWPLYGFFQDNPTHLEQGWPYVLTWSYDVVKIVLGYVLYKLYSSESRKQKIAGLILTVFIIVLPIILHYSNLETASIILGGWGLFILAANSVFLYMYWRYPERYDLDFVHKEISPIMVIVCIVAAFPQGGLAVLAALYFWVMIHSVNFGVIKIKKRTKS